MLLALHGFTESDLIWCDILRPAVADLVCPLLPGHGWKPCPPGTTMEAVADQLAAKHLVAPGDVFGYSMGGRIGLMLALRQPAKVRRLVLLSSGPGFKDEVLKGSRRTSDMATADTLEEEGINQFVAMWEKNPILKPYRPLPRAVEDELRARRMEHDAAGLAAVLRCLGVGAMPNLWDRLIELQAETLLIAGEADERYCQVMRDMASLIPRAQLEVVREAGHAVHRERPDEVRRLVRDFLK